LPPAAPYRRLIVFGQRSVCHYDCIMLTTIAAEVIEIRVITHDRLA
jgi:hypothetical protein